MTVAELIIEIKALKKIRRKCKKVMKAMDRARSMSDEAKVYIDFIGYSIDGEFNKSEKLMDCMNEGLEHMTNWYVEIQKKLQEIRNEIE